MLVGLELKQARKELGLTQKGLADELGVSLPTVVNWELGKSTPRGKNLQKLNVYFEKVGSENELFNDEMVDALQIVSDELGFADIQEMLRNLVRKHNLGMLDL